MPCRAELKEPKEPAMPARLPPMRSAARARALKLSAATPAELAINSRFSPCLAKLTVRLIMTPNAASGAMAFKMPFLSPINPFSVFWVAWVFLSADLAAESDASCMRLNSLTTASAPSVSNTKEKVSVMAIISSLPAFGRPLQPVFRYSGLLPPLPTAAWHPAGCIRSLIPGAWLCPTRRCLQ